MEAKLHNNKEKKFTTKKKGGRRLPLQKAAISASNAIKSIGRLIGSFGTLMKTRRRQEMDQLERIQEGQMTSTNPNRLSAGGDEPKKK